MQSIKSNILGIFLIYGIIVGILSSWWWSISDNFFLLNIPGELIGYQVYSLSIKVFGDPMSPQAHYTIPWLLRIPQVFVPVSTIFWIIIGVFVNAAFIRFRQKAPYQTNADYAHAM